jgi:hypothetical protein
MAVKVGEANDSESGLGGDLRLSDGESGKNG